MKIIENVIYREVVVVEVASSELGNSWTLAEKVRDSFLLMSTKEAFYDSLIACRLHNSSNVHKLSVYQSGP